MLTPTERRVALLVAWGGTNKQIAEMLQLDPRTVERQLAHIYLKLGVASRAELTSHFDGRTRGRQI